MNFSITLSSHLNLNSKVVFDVFYNIVVLYENFDISFLIFLILIISYIKIFSNTFDFRDNGPENERITFNKF